MSVLNISEVFKGNVSMLSSGDDIHVVHCRQGEDGIRKSVLLNMNLVTMVLHGCMQVHHHSGRLTILPMQGGFLKRGSYLMTELSSEADQSYEGLCVFFSDAVLNAATAGIFSGQGSGAARKSPSTYDNVEFLQPDALWEGVMRQLVQYVGLRPEVERVERVERLLPLKIRELLEVLVTSPQNETFFSFLQNIHYARTPELVEVMEAHFRENLSLEELAFLAGCSLSAFKRKFEDVYRESPGRWILLRRLQEAYFLLGDQRKNVTEVCFEVGFEHVVHFIAAFREQYYVTPEQLQKSRKTVLPGVPQVKP